MVIKIKEFLQWLDFRVNVCALWRENKTFVFQIFQTDAFTGSQRMLCIYNGAERILKQVAIFNVLIQFIQLVGKHNSNICTIIFDGLENQKRILLIKNKINFRMQLSHFCDGRKQLGFKNCRNRPRNSTRNGIFNKLKLLFGCIPDLKQIGTLFLQIFTGWGKGKHIILADKKAGTKLFFQRRNAFADCRMADK